MLQNNLKDVRDLLTEIKYPGTSKDIVALDMVQQIKIEGDKVSFRLVFQKANDPFVAALRKKCDALIKEKTAYKEVGIETVFVQEMERPFSLEKVKHIVAVSSGKGGVGNLPLRLILPWLWRNRGIRWGWWMPIFSARLSLRCSVVKMPVRICLK